MDDRFKILIVCTANQCRSPLAELLLQTAARRRGLSWHIASAGTHARPGLVMNSNAARVLRSQGITAGDWRTRRLEEWMLDSSGLILTATRQHRSMILSARPDLVAKTFPMLQFAALAESIRTQAATRTTPSSLDVVQLLRAVRVAQGKAQPQRPDDVDLLDPVGRSYRSFRVCATKIEAAVERIIAAAA